MTSPKDIIYKYEIKLDINKDAWNWYDACTGCGSHGMDWSKSAPENVLSEIKGKSKSEAYEFIIPYLKQKYIDDNKQITEAKILFHDSYENNFANACKKIEEVMGKPIYRNDFTIYLTTFPRAPYNFYEGSLYNCVNWINPIALFLHELSHFQFINYWRNNRSSAVSELSNAQFEWLKESLTIILDEDFLPIAECVDYGYKIHRPYRKELREFWKSNHNFDELVDFGIKLLPKYNIEIEADSKLSTYEKVLTPDNLQAFMRENIHYGFVDNSGHQYFYDDKDWDQYWHDDCTVQSGDELLKTKCGTCWDQVELERKWFAEHNYKFKTFFVWFDIKEPSNYPTHTFIAFHENDKWCWFENAFFVHRGIHEYNSLNELIDDVISKHLQAAIDYGVAKPADIKLINHCEYNKPKPNLGVDDYIYNATKQ